jgi:hypothetical protein
VKIAFAIAILALAVIVPLAGQGTWIRVAPAPATYAYESAESGQCSGTYQCSRTINTTNGDAIVAVCTGTRASFLTCTVSDTNGEIWTQQSGATTVPNYYSSASKTYVAFVAHGSTGDVVTVQHTGSAVVYGTLDAYRSSTGWSSVDGSSAMVLASNGGPCSVSFSSASANAKELIFGNCLANAGTPTAASGYTIDQTDSSTFISGHMAITTIQTPSFVSDGTLTGPQSLILGLIPN